MFPAPASDALSRWAEPANAIGAFLENQHVHLIAPFGLDDLLNMIVRPNLVTPNAKKVYLERLKTKGWQKKWPKITVLLP